MVDFVFEIEGTMSMRFVFILGVFIALTGCEFLGLAKKEESVSTGALIGHCEVGNACHAYHRSANGSLEKLNQVTEQQCPGGFKKGAPCPAGAISTCVLTWDSVGYDLVMHWYPTDTIDNEALVAMVTQQCSELRKNAARASKKYQN